MKFQRQNTAKAFKKCLNVNKKRRKWRHEQTRTWWGSNTLNSWSKSSKKSMVGCCSNIVLASFKASIRRSILLLPLSRNFTAKNLKTFDSFSNSKKNRSREWSTVSGSSSGMFESRDGKQDGVVSCVQHSVQAAVVTLDLLAAWIDVCGCRERATSFNSTSIDCEESARRTSSQSHSYARMSGSIDRSIIFFRQAPNTNEATRLFNSQLNLRIT